MAKTNAKTVTKAGNENKKTFEARLLRLETLGETIRKTGIPLDEALKAFEEGIKLAQGLEKDLEKIESRIEILMNDPDSGEGEEPVLDLFSGKESENF